MLTRLAVTVGLIVGAAGVTSQIATAIPLAPAKATEQAAGGFTPIPVQGGRCIAWAEECAARWGWRTPRYFRCMGRHGC